MAASFFFYDLETTGISAARDRIMQFAGQRTDLDLQPLGEPINVNIKLTADILPSPEAIVISGISPLQDAGKHLTEAEFTDLFQNQIAKPGTIFTGYNNVRFDDEFIRYLNYRNFYDAYSWHWQNNSSRWDLLDVVRMTRALRPEGINWSFNDEDKPTNRLELLTKANKLDHLKAHDALSDALATIEIAKLIKTRQPNLFSYLLKLRQKQTLIKVMTGTDLIVYTSSHYSSDVLHTTVITPLSFDPALGTSQVYDLRQDPKSFINLSTDDLLKLWQYDPDNPRPLLPLKTMKLNRCPAIAPISVLDSEAITRLKLDMKQIEANRQYLKDHQMQFADKMKLVAKALDKEREERIKRQPRIPTADEKLYDKFISRNDQNLFERARGLASQKEDFSIHFEDNRLNDLYLLYRARNYPTVLTQDERMAWNDHVVNKLFSGEPRPYEMFVSKINELKDIYKKEPTKLKLLSDLLKYGQAIAGDYEAKKPVRVA